MIVVVYAVAYGVEAVVVADVEAIAKVDYICHAFTSDALNLIVWETECKVISDCLGHYYIAYCRCLFWSRCFYSGGSCLCFWHCVG